MELEIDLPFPRLGRVDTESMLAGIKIARPYILAAGMEQRVLLPLAEFRVNPGFDRELVSVEAAGIRDGDKPPIEKAGTELRRGVEEAWLPGVEIARRHIGVGRCSIDAFVRALF